MLHTNIHTHLYIIKEAIKLGKNCVWKELQGKGWKGNKYSTFNKFSKSKLLLNSNNF